MTVEHLPVDLAPPEPHDVLMWAATEGEVDAGGTAHPAGWVWTCSCGESGDGFADEDAGAEAAEVHRDDDLGMRQAWAVYALTGCRVTFANNLERYWRHGEGSRKIRWKTPGDFTRCKRHLTKHVGSDRAARICASWHHKENGFWPGDKRNR